MSGVSDGQYANETTFNDAFMARNGDTDTIGKVGLLNTLPESGVPVANPQGYINELADIDGVLSFQDATAKTYANNNFIADGDNRKVAIEKLDAQLFATNTVAQSVAAANSQDVTLGAIGTNPNSHGATLTGQILNLEPASDLFGGIISTEAQIFAGEKTFQSGAVFQSTIETTKLSVIEAAFFAYSDDTSAGSNVTLPQPASPLIKLTNAALVSVANLTHYGAVIQYVVNLTGVDVTIKNLFGGVGQIDTGTGSDFVLKNGAGCTLWNDISVNIWHLIGGGGSGGATSSTASDLTLTASDNIAIDIASGFQMWLVQGLSTPVTLSATPFGTVAPVDGTEITLVGNSLDNTVTIPSNDAAKGVLGYEKTIGRGDTITYKYNSTLDRYVIKSVGA